MRTCSIEEADRYLGHYSDGAWRATRADNGRIRIIGPSEDYELDENEVTIVKLTAYLYRWRVHTQLLATARIRPRRAPVAIAGIRRKAARETVRRP
jgi:hypothetical protein